MNITFGICVSPETDPSLLWRQLNSIMNMAESLKYSEVILAGILSEYNMRLIEPFTLGICPIKLLPYEGPKDKPGHITKKKNMIADVAFYDTIIMMHDYYELPHNFFIGLPSNWDIICPKIKTLEGHRHSDWVVNPIFIENVLTLEWKKILMEIAPYENSPKYVCGLPYSVTDLTHIQYVSGGFLMIKTDIMRKTRFDENLYWGDAEDLEFSHRLNKMNMKFHNAEVRVLKPNKWHVSQMPDEFVNYLRKKYEQI